MKVGLLGAYSIDNAGDRLLGYAVRQFISSYLVPQHGERVELELLAPRLPGDSFQHRFDEEQGLGVPIRPIPADDSLDFVSGLDALIIGGGGIVSPESSMRPFLLGNPRLWGTRGVPAAWNSVCSQSLGWYLAEHGEGYDAVRACCQALRYVGVRNETTATFVRRCGYTGPLHRVPDSAIGLTIPPSERHVVDAEVERVLHTLFGQTKDAPLIGLSVGRAVLEDRAGGFFAGLFSTLRAALCGPLRARVLLFPFGGVYGDRKWLRAAADQIMTSDITSEIALLPAEVSPLFLYRLIGRLDLAIVTRYHAMIAAFNQNVPFLVLDEYLSDDIASSKSREFIVENGLEPCYLCPYLGTDPTWKVQAMLMQRQRISYLGTLAVATKRLQNHYHEMLRALWLMRE